MSSYLFGARIASIKAEFKNQSGASRININSINNSANFSDEIKLVLIYLEYEISREFNVYLFSSMFGIDALHGILESLINRVFQFAMPDDSTEIVDYNPITVEITTTYRPIRYYPQLLQGLGSNSGSVLGESLVTNGNLSECIPNLRIIIKLSLEQYFALERSPYISKILMKALDQCIPLNLDYYTLIALRDEDYDFRLSSQFGKARIGLNSVLGRESGIRVGGNNSKSEKDKGKISVNF